MTWYKKCLYYVNDTMANETNNTNKRKNKIGTMEISIEWTKLFWNELLWVFWLFLVMLSFPYSRLYALYGFMFLCMLISRWSLAHKLFWIMLLGHFFWSNYESTKFWIESKFINGQLIIWNNVFFCLLSFWI